MKHLLICLAAIFTFLPAGFVRGNTLYVNLNSANPTPPYSDWGTAATNIQDAIDASTDGDQIWVTNGVYQTGGRAMAGDLTNRIVLDKAVTVQSVNGPFVTTIAGIGATNNAIAVRCAWLTNNAALIGFTLTQGATRGSSPDQISFGSGGAVWCASSNAVITGCVIVSNTAFYRGGAAYQGTLNACFISSNSVPVNLPGGAVYTGILNNCTVVSNYCTALVSCRVTNCISYYNQGNYNGGSFAYSCTTPNPIGTGNFANAPQFFADHIHLTPGSSGIGAGTTTVTSMDIFGKVWENPASVGCAETGSLPLVTTPQVQLLSLPVGFMMANVFFSGTGPFSFNWLKDGTSLQDDGHFAFTHSTNLTATGVTLSDAGNYQLIVSNASGMTTTAVAQVTIHCVNAMGVNPVAPYTTWQTAATNIQDAITAAMANEIVLVTNGIYATGGKSMDNVITNRVSVDKAILVQSVTGPDTTIIQGTLDPATTNGTAAVRCVWMTNNSILSGFTVYGGATRSVSASPNQSMSGGGVWGAATNVVVDHCVIVTNYASHLGGGAYSATLNYCTLMGNHAVGSGTAGVGVAGAGSGGGAASSRLKNCLITSNVAEQSNGGGTQNCNSTNCAFLNNRAPLLGSAAYQGTLVNCTLANNTSGGYGAYGGAAASATLANCIVYGNFNIGPGSTNYTSCTFSYSDTDPLPAGTGNIDVDPQLLPDNIHLAAPSPCIGAGNSNIIIGADIDNQVWNSPPSIGCDEWNPVPLLIVQPTFLAGMPSRRCLNFNVVAAGLPAFSYFWYKDGGLIQESAHSANTSDSNLVINGFQPEDSGSYQLVISNAYGMVTSKVTQVTIHTVDIANTNPVAPYSSWQTAATNIQDAIDAAANGDIVLVTNGIFATGGKVTLGDLTNRVALDKALTVISLNGYTETVIEGAWDPISTNGPAAVRCAWLTKGAALNGFTLRNGATRVSSDSIGYGGGALLVANAMISNCVLTNNSAQAGGGGAASGTLNNCFLSYNSAPYGGGAYACKLNNCTLRENHSSNPTGSAGVYFCTSKNCIITDNYRSLFGISDYSLLNFPVFSANFFTNCCTSPMPPSGANNITVNPLYLDFNGGFALSPASPCRGAGNPLFTIGYDLDGDPYLNPPSMGCDEIIATNLGGPLSFSFQYLKTNALAYHNTTFVSQFEGRPSELDWSFGDGPTVTNLGAAASHTWTNSGTYPVSLTAYNVDHPSGVSSNFVVTVDPFLSPSLQFNGIVSNAFEFNFLAQGQGLYTVQYATNLTPPVAWQNLQVFLFSTSNTVMTIRDPAVTNAQLFYRIFGQ